MTPALSGVQGHGDPWKLSALASPRPNETQDEFQVTVHLRTPRLIDLKARFYGTYANLLYKTRYLRTLYPTLHSSESLATCRLLFVVILFGFFKILPNSYDFPTR